MFWYILQEITRFSIPMLVAVVMQYLDGSGKTSDILAYISVVLIILFSFLLVPMHAHYFLMHFYSGMLMRSTCASLIYRKVRY